MIAILISMATTKMIEDKTLMMTTWQTIFGEEGVASGET